MRKDVSVGFVGVLLCWGMVAANPLRPLTSPPVQFYEKHCASCHGKEGAMFTKPFENKYASVDELREMVRSMPGADALDEAGLQAMVAYMRAISRGEPFIAWTRERDRVIEGEVSPANAVLTAAAGRLPLSVERPAPNRWRIRLPAKVKPANVRLRASLGSKAVVLFLKDSRLTQR